MSARLTGWLIAACLLLAIMGAVRAATVKALPPKPTCTIIFGPPDADFNRTVTLVCDHPNSKMKCGDGEPWNLTAPDKNGVQVLTVTCKG